ncbi:MAG: amino acid adenylation domain-containing protein [Synergistaceae bacterium]|nr:amino acid adenylation domain-containing protein [Synergistaceae bacterium]MBR0249622.1 amino acid adenylation domain-containing protein [Synergistaceae bacterium]
MARIVTDYLDHTAETYPDKPAFIDRKRSISFRELQNEAHHIASEIIALGLWKQPVVVYLNKSVECIAAFEGVTYSGNFYSPLDTKMPPERIHKIIDRLKPSAVITDSEHKSEAEEFSEGAHVILYDEAQKNAINYEGIENAKNRIIDTDILYVLFTSGSTGIPKGAIISHRNLIDFTEWLAEKLHFNNETVFANQSPFYFSMSVVDIYQALRAGGSDFIVPEILFNQPAKLMHYLDEHKVSYINWVPSILQFISALKALNRPHLSSMKTISFGGEVFQTKHLNRWMNEYPEVKFVNLFGPTETTDTCTYYEIARHFDDNEMLPIGYSCRNKECFLLDENDTPVTKPEILGEICVRGSGIGYGYYNDPENTAKAFVQNPLNTAYPEIIYRTGDLAKYNEYGEMVYVCRKDFQIKHLGRRIELGEIEAAVSAVDGIEDCCCLYDSENVKIVLFYAGDTDNTKLNNSLKVSLPDYMLPGRYIKLEQMPLNLNGKIDRQKLKEFMKGE